MGVSGVGEDRKIAKDPVTPHQTMEVHDPSIKEIEKQCCAGIEFLRIW